MNAPKKPLPFDIRAAASLADEELAPMMDESFAGQMATDLKPSPTLLAGILGRVRSSVAKASDKTLARGSRIAKNMIGEGVSAKTLFKSDSASLRLGEPVRVCILEFNPGSRLSMAQASANGALSAGSIDREWLVLKGDITLAGEMLSDRDYKIMPRAYALHDCESITGAVVLVRESMLAKSLSDAPVSMIDSCDHWPEYAPGIRRRVLWERDGQAAMLYLTEPLAEVPHHSHHHDEECFMVQGELYLDDTLLMEGDYQLAKGGSQHEVTRTDTGVVLFAHGDVDLRFIS
jgi:quercetin dioxygenase-like cupin family protein